MKDKQTVTSLSKAKADAQHTISVAVILAMEKYHRETGFLISDVSVQIIGHTDLELGFKGAAYTVVAGVTVRTTAADDL